ncbi:flagellin [Cohnella laeviribosi]|nr:flagellin [Cohnella laeviribosi]
MAKIRNAINIVSAERARLGAYQNRLEHTLNNVQHYAENLSASESRIRDADMAKEMTELTRSQILAEAGKVMLAQANALPRFVLKLLE